MKKFPIFFLALVKKYPPPPPPPPLPGWLGGEGGCEGGNGKGRESGGGGGGACLTGEPHGLSGQLLPDSPSGTDLCVRALLGGFSLPS